jgi:hypothetical protein
VGRDRACVRFVDERAASIADGLFHVQHFDPKLAGLIVLTAALAGRATRGSSGLTRESTGLASLNVTVSTCTWSA